MNIVLRLLQQLYQQILYHYLVILSHKTIRILLQKILDNSNCHCYFNKNKTIITMTLSWIKIVEVQDKCNESL